MKEKDGVPTNIHIRCAGHVLNLIVKKVINHKQDSKEDDSDIEENTSSGAKKNRKTFELTEEEASAVKQYEQVIAKLRKISSKFSMSTILNDNLYEYQKKLIFKILFILIKDLYKKYSNRKYYFKELIKKKIR